MNPIRSARWLMLSVAVACTLRATETPHAALSALTWSKGPARVDLQIGATFSLPQGFLFLDGAGTRKLLAEFGNKVSGREIGFLTPLSRSWFVIVEHLDLGHVLDDEQGTLDPSVMLRRLQRSDEEANAEREQNSWPAVTVLDWALPPQYDAETHSMEWAVRAESRGKSVVNHTLCLLGRKGAVQFSLIDPDLRSSSVAVFRELVRGISFAAGNRYVDYQPGDSVARGGLDVLFGGAPELEPVDAIATDSARGETETQTVSTWKSPWLAAILAAAAVGFVCGRVTRGRSQRHHGRLEMAYETRTSNRRRPESPGVSAAVPSAAPGVSGETTGSSPWPTSRGETRIRRYDSYSFYRALTRDLHWTINY